MSYLKLHLNIIFIFLFLITYSICWRVNTIPAPMSPNCIKQMNETIYPKCFISFREEGSFGSINATCLEDNIFLISPNRTKPRSSFTTDYLYFTSVFGENLPPYARISCTSLFPTDFDFEGVGALDFFRVWKGQRRYEQNTTYTINAEILLTPEATGKYIFRSINDSEIETSIFIFSERGSKPYLIGGTRTIPAITNGTTSIIPCIASDLIANVTLFKRADDMIWVPLKSQKQISYDRQNGFIVNPAGPGEYRCFSDSEESESTDYVTVHVKSPTEQNIVSKPKKIALEIINNTAVCSSTENRTDIKFSNAYGRNPTETHLLALCLERKNPYCGSHSYHQRREGRKIDNRPCPNNLPSCLWITDVHLEGIFYCEIGDEGESITQEYFTGLDGKIYKNTSEAATKVLIRPEWRPNNTALKTGTLYEFTCEAVGLLFLKDPFILSVKFKNGTVNKLAEIVWWQGSRSFYLTTDMDEIICSDNLWKTNELISSATPITVTEKQCDHDQFKCKSGQCIREAWQCDGDKDCGDESDEDNCKEHHCKYGHFKCTNGLCVTNEKKCNNKNDCQDGSDESFQLCSNMTCTLDDFKCSSGQCAPAHFLCDGDKDCFDQSDEAVEHCSKYYPKLTQTRTHVIFTPNTINELVCKSSVLPIRLKPVLSWWRRGQNISDPERLWTDNTGLNLALRFHNISQDDTGEYTCVAINKLQRVVQVFMVTVQLPEPDMGCSPQLRISECLNRGCAYVNKTCINAEDAPITQAPTTTTSTSTVWERIEMEIPTTELPPVEESAANTDTEDSHSGSGLAIGLSLLIFAVVGLVLSGLGWRYYTRRYVPVGSARMREDQEVVLGGI